MAQLSLETFTLQNDLEQSGFSLLNHGIPPELIDSLIVAYADFTDNLPLPQPETLSLMIPDVHDLDNLDYHRDTQAEWHKYRTNHPRRAKPGGYTDRSAQIAALRIVGRDQLDDGTYLTDDPKEFYHYHPDSLGQIIKRSREMGWGPIPPEVDRLHQSFARVYNLGQLSVRASLAQLEETHPELLSKFARPEDIAGSPMRLLFYHKNGGDILAGGHYDKSWSTLQVAESHKGLRIRHPLTGEMIVIDRPEQMAVFFISKLFEQMYPEDAFKATWHDVIKMDQLNEARQLHGLNCARWALILFFHASPALYLPNKQATHLETPKLIVSSLEEQAAVLKPA